MDSTVGISLTEDEAELYDRQIRLWGLEAQQRLRKAKVLLVGISPTAAEIAKNIVLSGINSLTLLDDQTVTEMDINHNFLLSSDSLGKNRAESARLYCQELNPMVSLEVKEQDFSKLTAEDLKSYDLTCLAAESPSRADLIYLNAECRKAKCKLIIVSVFGHYGCSFSDLLDHDYAEEEIPIPTEKADGPPTKKPKVDEQEDTASRMVKKNAHFCSLVEALETDWSSATRRTLRRLSPAYFLLQTMLHREKSSKEIDSDELKLAWKTYSEKQSLDSELLKDEQFKRCEGIVAPVFPIVGGVVGQEIIKTVSHKDPPLKNFFFFDADDCSGSVHAIGPLTSSSK